MRVFGLALCLSLLSFGAARADITVTTEEYPPFNTMVNGQIGGLSTDVVKAMFQKAGVPYTLQLLPWERAYAMALGTKDTCVYSTSVTDARRPLFEWVGPLANNDWELFGRADRTYAIKTLADAKAYTIGGYRGDATAAYLESVGLKVDEAPRDALNLPKLLNNRIDLWATGSAVGPYIAKQAGSTAIKPVLDFKQLQLALACNKGTDPAVLAKLRTALAEVKPAH
jgi:polar amino acid transport system substrate-binding protein